MNESAEQIMDAFDYYFEDTHDLGLRVKYNVLRAQVEYLALCHYKGDLVPDLIELAKAKAVVESKSKVKTLDEAAETLLSIWKQER